MLNFFNDIQGIPSEYHHNLNKLEIETHTKILGYSKIIPLNCIIANLNAPLA